MPQTSRNTKTPQNSEENKPYVPKLSPAMEAAQWKPGQSGNPGGRPKKKPVTDALRVALDTIVPGDKEGRTYAEVIAFALVHEALAGKNKVSAASEIADRVEGKPGSRMEIDASLSVEEVSHPREMTEEEIDARLNEIARRRNPDSTA
jgi:hypothetical protein